MDLGPQARAFAGTLHKVWVARASMDAYQERI